MPDQKRSPNPSPATLPRKIASADNHVAEPEGLLERLPEDLKFDLPRWEVVNGVRMELRPGCRPIQVGGHVEPVGDELEFEFRADPTGGRDLNVRIARQEKEGVHAEVIYPDGWMWVNMHRDPRCQAAICRLYNDFVAETFGPRPDRFAAAGLIPTADINDAIREVERAAKIGLKAVMLPITIPWKPYDQPEYEPLWAAIEAVNIPISFHVFTGNGSGALDFADIFTFSDEVLATLKRERSKPLHEEMLSNPVIGMAAAIGPLVHLTGSGVLERHPKLRFALVEGEAGWLAWTLTAMDQMYHRRHFGIRRLSMLPSEFFRRQGYVTFIDDPVAMATIDIIGADRMMWANDFPHDEGTLLRSRQVIESTMGGLAPAVREKLLWTNAAKLYRFED